MSTTARRVALLARPGLACDRLRGALAEAGAELVLEADPLTLDPATLDAAQAQVVLVALDTQTEEALDRFEAALHNPAIEVIFEEAELAARREGWEAARWARHLAAKLHRHDDVLPPGSESAALPMASDADRASTPEPVLDFGSESDGLGGFAFDDTPDPDAAAGTTMHPFDPLFAEIAFDDAEPTVETGLDAYVPADDASSAFDPSLNFSFDGDFDSIETGATPVAADYLALVEPLDELDGATGARDPGFDRMFDGDFSASAVFAPHVAESASIHADADADLAGPVGGRNKQVLELVSTDDDHGLRSEPAAGADGIAAEHLFKHDLASLESRIAGMELVDDRIVKGPAQAHGAVLVLAGIGGPDAVRQLLGALPEGFPRPVLVQQRLDGGRYDKLVAQMQRATTMAVKLAEPGSPAMSGVIYILPAGTCIEVAEAGIHFTDGGDDVLAALPSADSAVLLLSGSDPAQVDAVMNHSWAGALVIGQAPDGCYDAAAPNALLARGGGSGPPAELAARLSERWRS